MDTAEARFVHVGVDLGGGDVGMAEHFLDDAEVCAVGEEMGGEAVAHEVGVGIEAGGEGRLPAEVIARGMGNLTTDTHMVPVPLSHNTGFTSATIALLSGQHLVLMRRFVPEDFLRLIAEHRVNYLATVPTIMQRLLPVYQANPDAYDLSSLRRLWHLAAPCPAQSALRPRASSPGQTRPRAAAAAPKPASPRR